MNFDTKFIKMHNLQLQIFCYFLENRQFEVEFLQNLLKSVNFGPKFTKIPKNCVGHITLLSKLEA